MRRAGCAGTLKDEEFIRYATAILLLLVASSVLAAEPDLVRYDKYLVPLSDTSRALPGVNGSLWVTELRARNLGPTEESLEGAFCDPRITDPNFWCRSLPFRPQESRGVNFDAPTLTGAFLYVKRKPFALSLRVRDVSRVAQSFGTAIPVPLVSSCTSTGWCDSDFGFSSHLTDVPTDGRYRATLRVYSATSDARRVVIRVRADDGTLIEQQTVDLPKAAPLSGLDPEMYPATAEFDPLTPAVREAGERVSIEVVDPVFVPGVGSHTSPPAPKGLWALLSITNNETQQVTVVAPTRIGAASR